jgi:hypothetical protein
MFTKNFNYFTFVNCLYIGIVSYVKNLISGGKENDN